MNPSLGEGTGLGDVHPLPLYTGDADEWAVTEPAAIRETHTSVVLLVGDRAYKVKKPVRFPFLDLSTRAARMDNCVRELELNRRLSPDVYLGVDELRPVAGDTGDEGEPVLVMRRLPEDRRLSTLLTDPGRSDEARRCVLDVARQVATFHAALPDVGGPSLADGLAALWRAGWEQARELAPELPRAEVDDIHALADEYLRGRGELLAMRQAAGMVRDGHGDLLTDDIFWLDDGARILDCLEFDETLRHGDVLMDIGFLLMDLEMRGADDLARAVVERYRELTGETHPRSLERHFVAYRAFVRAKVEALQARSGDAEARSWARRALNLSRHALTRGRVHLVLVGGLPGSGKSTLAERLVDDPQHDWVLLSSDEVRKELAGLAPLTDCAAPYRTGLYDARHTDATYSELLRRAGVALGQGVSVVVDASWTSARHRALAEVVARTCAAALTQVRCVVPVPVATERVVARSAARHVSDATAEVVSRMARDTDEWTSGIVCDTTRPLESVWVSVQRAMALRPFPVAPDGPA